MDSLNLLMDGFAQALTEPVLAMHRSIKAALDPRGILNPGKVLRDDRGEFPTGP